MIVTIVLAAGCAETHPGFSFGNNFVERVDDADGVPTYSILGPLAPGEDPENIATKVMLAACPSGHPRLMFAHGMSSQITGNGPKLWDGAFTCNYAIK